MLTYNTLVNLEPLRGRTFSINTIITICDTSICQHASNTDPNGLWSEPIYLIPHSNFSLLQVYQDNCYK